MTTAAEIRALREGWRDAAARAVTQMAESEALAAVLGFSVLAGAPDVPASGTAEELAAVQARLDRDEDALVLARERAE